MLVYLLVVAVVLVAALLAVGLAALLHLQGTAAIVFIALILLAGITVAVVILVLHFRAKKKAQQDGEVTTGGATGELDILLNDANRKLRESQQGAKALDGIPLIYILGDTGTAKTYPNCDPIGSRSGNWWLVLLRRSMASRSPLP